MLQSRVFGKKYTNTYKCLYFFERFCCDYVCMKERKKTQKTPSEDQVPFAYVGKIKTSAVVKAFLNTQVYNYYNLLSRERIQNREKKREQEKMDSVRVRVMNRQNQDSHQAEISEDGRPFLNERGKNFPFNHLPTLQCCGKLFNEYQLTQ